jgi:aryl carrier-like protein
MTPTVVAERIGRAFARHRPIGPDVSFFEAGFTSATLAEVLTELRAMGFGLTLLDLYRFPTVRALAAELSRRADPGLATRPRLPWSRPSDTSGATA